MAFGCGFCFGESKGRFLLASALAVFILGCLSSRPRHFGTIVIVPEQLDQQHPRQDSKLIGSGGDAVSIGSLEGEGAGVDEVDGTPRVAKTFDLSVIPQCELAKGSGVLGKKRKYRAVMLVLASVNDPKAHPKSLYNGFKKAWDVVRLQEASIKVFFVYGTTGIFLKDLGDTGDSEHNLVYPKLRDSYPVYVDKVVCAMKHIDDNYDYDFFIKSNLSTFWDLKALLRHLKELANKAVYEGDGPLPPWLEPSKRYYVSGVDTIMNRYMVTALVKEADKVGNFTREMRKTRKLEDQAIGMFMHVELGAPLKKSMGIQFVDFHRKDEKGLAELIQVAKGSNKTHYRVKSTSREKRAEIDLWVTHRLLREYYGFNGTIG
ncbi:hypothetical protein AAMO2058_001004800 [Amorphochlora amoebiformis]